MKLLVIALLFISSVSIAQQPCENIFIITTDGYRWQELFNGADSALLFDKRYVQDTAIMKDLFWADSPEERRKKLMPFTWNLLAARGQLWGNRHYQNKVSVANPYRFSYAGYNEILTGFADPAVITNKPRKNGNANLLSYLHELPAYRDRIAVFGSWNLFSYILDGPGQKLSVNCGYQPATDDSLSVTEKAVNYLQETSSNNGRSTRSDMLTFSLAAEHIAKKHPRIVYIGFGETDEFAHHSQYDNYLSQANMFDKMLAELWSLVQRDEFYKNKTTFFITTDHGRGRRAANWNVHGPLTPGSDETWLMQLGPNVEARGEIKQAADFNNEQFAQTIAAYLGEYFTSDHPVAMPVYGLLGEKKQ